MYQLGEKTRPVVGTLPVLKRRAPHGTRRIAISRPPVLKIQGYGDDEYGVGIAPLVLGAGLSVGKSLISSIFGGGGGPEWGPGVQRVNGALGDAMRGSTTGRCYEPPSKECLASSVHRSPVQYLILTAQGQGNTMPEVIAAAKAALVKIAASAPEPNRSEAAGYLGVAISGGAYTPGPVLSSPPLGTSFGASPTLLLLGIAAAGAVLYFASRKR